MGHLLLLLLPTDREACIWDLEERHQQEKHQLVKQQLKDQYFLQRHELLRKHEKVKALHLPTLLWVSKVSRCPWEFPFQAVRGEGWVGS